MRSHAPGGIYVHRWFVIDANAIDEFVALLRPGWADFESRFEANIFGLWDSEAYAGGSARRGDAGLPADALQGPRRLGSLPAIPPPRR